MPLFLGSTKVALNMGDRIGENVLNQSKSITPTKSTQTITPDPGYTGLSSVVVNAIPNSYIIPSGTYTVSSASNEIDIRQYASLNVPSANIPSITFSSYSTTQGANLYYTIHPQYNFSTSGFVPNGISSHLAINIPAVSGRTITPTTSSQIAINSYNMPLGNIIVNAIPNEYIVPSGTITYNSAGTYDVTNYSYVNINLPVYNGELVS